MIPLLSVCNSSVCLPFCMRAPCPDLIFFIRLLSPSASRRRLRTLGFCSPSLDVLDSPFLLCEDGAGFETTMGFPSPQWIIFCITWTEKEITGQAVNYRFQTGTQKHTHLLFTKSSYNRRNTHEAQFLRFLSKWRITSSFWLFDSFSVLWFLQH